MMTETAGWLQPVAARVPERTNGVPLRHAFQRWINDRYGHAGASEDPDRSQTACTARRHGRAVRVERLLLDGATEAAAARAEGVSPRTVRRHVKAIRVRNKETRRKVRAYFKALLEAQRHGRIPSQPERQ